jgi:CheY-like chemotaxis protein
MKFNNKFISKLKKRLFGKSNSLNAALKKIAGKKVLEKLSVNNTDWRNLPLEAAQVMEIPLNELLHKVAENFHVPYISRVPHVDIELLPQGLSVADLRRMACIPRFGNSGITGLICLDPARARMLFGGGSELPIAIASWNSIHAALDESEKARNAKYREIDETKALQAIEAAKQAMHLVICQLKTFNVESLDLNFSEEGKIKYSFITREGKTAEGNIHNRVRDALYALLSEYSSEDISVLQLSDIIKHSIKASIDESRTLFNISLQNKIVRFPEPMSLRNEIVPLSKDVTHEILIVDDNQIFAKVLEKFLVKLNVKSVFAQNGREALKYITEAENKPDVVICDLHMPEMNGCEFVQRLRGDQGQVDLPVIILTSDNDVETELKLLTDGADAFIAKSEDPRLLCVKIEKLLQRARKRKAA